MKADDWLGTTTSDFSSVGQAGFRALMVVGASQLVKLVINVAGTLVLVRILMPEAFGLAAMAALLTNFIFLFKDFGLGTVTVQCSTLSQRQTSTLFWLTQLGGVSLASLGLMLTPLLVWFFSTPELDPALRVLSLSFVLGALGSQHAALMLRKLCFIRLGVVEITAIACGFVVALTLASLGHGWWSLIWQRVVQIAISTVGMWIVCSWRPSIAFGFYETREQIKLAMHVAGANLAGFASRNTDNLLIGWYWGAVPLGLYSKAYDLLMAPLSQVSGALGQVFQPLLGRLRDDSQRYSILVTHALTGSLLILLPVGILMIFQSTKVTQVLLGATWLSAAPVVGWFGLAMCLQLCGSILMWSLITRQRGRDLSRTTLVNTVVNIVGFVLSVPHGIAAVAATYTLLGAFVRIPFAMYVCTGDSSFPRRAALRALVLPITVFGILCFLFVVIDGSSILENFADWQILMMQLFMGYSITFLLAIRSSFWKFVRRSLNAQGV